MANRYFNKQVTESRKPLSIGGPLTPKKLKFFDNTDKTPKPKSFDNTDRTDREKIIKDKIKDRLEKLKNSKPELKGMEGFRKVSPKPLDNIRSKGDKMKEYLIGNKEFRDKLRKKKSDMRTNKKTYAPEWKHNPKITKAKAEKYADAENRSKVRIKKKEVEGLK